MSHCSRPFVIVADTETGLARQFRLNHASAMSLADAWAEAGHENVRIVDPDGAERDLSQFRETLTFVRRVRRLTLALA